jgi:uncharacterized glyoxalase superfamily protein PhnB
MIDASSRKLGSAVVPVLRYRNLPAAIDWLCEAFGFEKHRVTVDSNGVILFAQLIFGNSLIMAGPVRSSAFDKLMKQPDEVGGAETQVCYFFVADAHAHCARAKVAGASIVVKDRANGGRSYSCRDPEGHLWNFGTYDPWHHHAIGHLPARPRRDLPRILVNRSVLLVALLVSMAAVIVPAARAPDPRPIQREIEPIETGSINAGEERSTTPELRVGNQTAESKAEKATEATEQLAGVGLKMIAPRKAATEAGEELALATRNREELEHLAEALRERLAKALTDKNLAERAVREARRQLARERAARKTPWGERTQDLLPAPPLQ